MIGAGPAGLTAARVVVAAGRSLAVLEARDRGSASRRRDARRHPHPRGRTRRPDPFGQLNQLNHRPPRPSRATCFVSATCFVLPSRAATPGDASVEDTIAPLPEALRPSAAGRAPRRTGCSPS
ncbi:NAD(P)-binding protein [Streptomyces sp. S.PNR 29]|uniref:NAD(P)-binding protein n=1 Tax=Streptomyces sp. S.PNR 29 TaxID=2973805 RepID=UPI0025B23237|nr:NAD(P)-binding protein [Streptomyces sp. S.PNR 29]MDN0198872.1 NAD(P)-binding protein [Streptomyces sp. S.PNR 29]